MTHAIAGARGRIEDPEETLMKAHAWAERHECEVLLADASAVFGRDHVESAVRHAVRAREAAAMVARTVALEALRYLAAQRQVVDAIRDAGIRAATEEIAVVIFGKTDPTEMLKKMGWRRDDDVLRARGKPLDRLGISAEEATTVPEDRRTDLALERVALLDVHK